MARTTVQVTGLRELGQAMKSLGNAVGLKLSSQATGAGARVIRDQVKANIRSNASRDGDSIETGSMLDAAIVKKIPAAQAETTAEHIVTFRGRGKAYNKKGQRIARAPHAHLVEFGTVNMPAEPNMQQAFQQKKGDALTAMTKSLQRGIDREAKKAGKK